MAESKEKLKARKAAAAARAKALKEKAELAKHTSFGRQLSGFMQFVREQGVVGLAVGLVLGTAVKSVVDSLVNNIVNPLLGLISGGADLSDQYACLSSVTNNGVTVCQNKLGYGQLIADVISFITIAAIVYFVVRGLKLDRLDVKKQN